MWQQLVSVVVLLIPLEEYDMRFVAGDDRCRPLEGVRVLDLTRYELKRRCSVCRLYGRMHYSLSLTAGIKS